MMINISRFIIIQEKLHRIINDYVKEIQDAIKVYSDLDENMALKMNILKTYMIYFLKEYGNLYNWKDIQSNLKSSTISIKVFKENSNSKELDYEEYEKKWWAKSNSYRWIYTI